MSRYNKRKGESEACICGDYDKDEVEFLVAIDRYKREKKNPYPSWKQVLDLLRSLGWEKKRAV